MKWMLDLPFSNPGVRIHHSHPLFLLGSCFTQNVGHLLQDHFFNVLSNPGGIVFDPLSVRKQLRMMMETEPMDEDRIFCQDEIFHHPDFHSDLSSMNREELVQNIRETLKTGREQLRTSQHLILTFGTAFAYRFRSDGYWVANCHRVAADAYEKCLLDPEDLLQKYSGLYSELKAFNPELQLILTVSPVRHIRDGLLANNRSKARLLEFVHAFNEAFPEVWYFPSYEWVVDVLRDYRWYDADLVHPNYAATQSIFEKFCEQALDEWTLSRLPSLREIRLGLNHVPRFPDSAAHRQFVERLQMKKNRVETEMPWIKW